MTGSVVCFGSDMEITRHSLRSLLPSNHPYIYQAKPSHSVMYTNIVDLLVEKQTFSPLSHGSDTEHSHLDWRRFLSTDTKYVEYKVNVNINKLASTFD